jgi:phosphohistidine phosphatase
MRLLIVRHAIAGDRVAFAATGRPDAERPLTGRGRRQMWLEARGLVKALPSLDRIASSSLKRARQTARIIASAYGRSQVTTVAGLTPGADPADLIRWLNAQTGTDCVAIVGHEPDVGMLVSLLLAGTRAVSVRMKKGAACLIEFSGDVAPGAGTLCWHLAPKQLRLLGGGDD